MKDTELKEMRDREFYRLYVRSLDDGMHFESQRKAADILKDRPAPGYFISAREASLQIGKLMCHVQDIGVSSQQRRKINDIYRRYKEYLRSHTDCAMSRIQVLELIVDDEAPEWYMTSELARKILRKECRRRRKELGW